MRGALAFRTKLRDIFRADKQDYIFFSHNRVAKELAGGLRDPSHFITAGPRQRCCHALHPVGPRRRYHPAGPADQGVLATILATAAVRQGFFAKEGIGAESTVYRGGAECFEALAAGAADLILDPPSLVAMDHLDAFLEAVMDRGVTIQQEFPSDCVPNVPGHTSGLISQLVSIQ